MIFGNESAPMPEELRTDWFIARPLTKAYAELDYEAYIASRNVIEEHSAGRWQTEGYTLEDNRREAAAHEVEHAARRSLAFILLSPDERKSLGCVYFNPLQAFLNRAVKPGWGAESGVTEEAIVSFWVRGDEQEGEMPDVVVREVEKWLRDEWNFEGHLWRIREQETRSQLVLKRAGLRGRYAIDVEGIGRYGFFS